MYKYWCNVFSSVKRIFKRPVLYENQFTDKITLLVSVHNNHKKRIEFPLPRTSLL